MANPSTTVGSTVSERQNGGPFLETASSEQDLSEQKVESFFESQRTMTAILMGWAVGSMATGWLWMARTSKVLRGVGSQFFVWGAIDAVLAWFGLRNSRNDAAQYYSKTLTLDDVDRKARGLRRLLWFNFGLDIIYMIIGRRMMRNENAMRRGSGIGVFIQGAFLFVFDALFADRIQPPKQQR
jgi:hypothetical protein